MSKMAEMDMVKEVLEKHGALIAHSNGTKKVIPLDIKGLGWTAHLEFSSNGKLIVGNFQPEQLLPQH